MSESNYRVSHPRAGNAVKPMPQAIGSKTDARWATGRNVKRSLPNHRWDIVQVWTLKERREGKVVTVDTHQSRKNAERWVAGGHTFRCAGDCAVPHV